MFQYLKEPKKCSFNLSAFQFLSTSVHHLTTLERCKITMKVTGPQCSGATMSLALDPREGCSRVPGTASSSPNPWASRPETCQHLKNG